MGLALVLMAAAPALATKPTATPPPAAAAKPMSPKPPAPAPPPPVPITIAYRLGDYGALPFVIAADQGWWQKAGLQPTFVMFAAEAPLLEAGAAKSWDVAAAGGLAAVLGASRFGLKTVGIADDASDTNVVMARPGEVDAVFKDPAFLRGKTLLLTLDTTAEYAALACLAKWHIARGEVTIDPLTGPQIVATFAQSKAALAALSAPEDYTLFQTGGAITVCSAKNGGATIPQGFVARPDFAAKHPDLVARFLAVALQTIAWQKTHRAATLDALRRFYQAGGVTLDAASLDKEIDDRPTFALGEQLRLLDRSKGGESPADRWFGGLAAYLVATGSIQAPPIAEGFVTDRYLKWVEGDKMLKGLVESGKSPPSDSKKEPGKTP